MHPMATVLPTALPPGREVEPEPEVPLLQVRPTRRPYPLPEFVDASPALRSDLAPPGLGVALTLALRLHDGAGQAIQRAAVYIWHYDPCCWLLDAGDDELRAVAMMRGMQLSDADGHVCFHTVYPGRYRDNTVPVVLQVYFNDGRHVIARADAWIFPGRWYLAGARWPLPALELAHAVYFSYYLLLFVPALVVERRRQLERREVDRYLHALTATLLAHYALNFLLPVAGPLADRARDMPEGALFLPLMDAIYFAFDRGGLAFPSTHVAASVVAGWFAGRSFFPRAGAAFAVWVTAISASTVICGYHYPIDALAGLATGGACLAAVLQRERPTAAGSG